MNDDTPADAKIKPMRQISKMWIIPIMALIIGGWLVYYNWSNQGKTITIFFNSAKGLVAGKTKIKSRYVDIGYVESIKLLDKGVSVVVRMNKGTEGLLVADSEFWIVSSRVSLSEISGLETILSGNYIKLSPGSSKEKIDTFKALSAPPITPNGTPGLHLTLNSHSQFAYSEGDPIIYKGLAVGKIDYVFFNVKERIVYYNAFIKAPYHQLITKNTRFWDATGFGLEFSENGIALKVASLETLITNAVTFGVPEGLPFGEKVTDREYFDIHENYADASNAHYKHFIEYVILVDDSVRGLSTGASVEYRGIPVGNVSAIRFANEKDDGNPIPILVKLRLYPAKFSFQDSQIAAENLDKIIENWIENGLTATLEIGNLLTGKFFVSLHHNELEAPFKIATYQGYDIIPTEKDTLSKFVDEIENIIGKLNKLPLEDISANANNLLINVSDLTKDLRHVGSELNIMLNDINQKKLPESLKNALENLSVLSQGFSEGSSNYTELHSLLKNMSQTLYELNPMLKQLKEKPNSLIFNDGLKPFEPKKH